MRRQKGDLTIILLVLAVIFLGTFGVSTLLLKSGVKRETRVNPEPQSQNKIAVTSNLTPGRRLVVDSIELKQGGYVVVYKDVNGKPGTVIGKSNLLGLGESRNVEINLSQSVKDGEVVYISLHSKQDILIKDANNNPLQIQRIIGHPALHYYD